MSSSLLIYSISRFSSINYQDGVLFSVLYIVQDQRVRLTMPASRTILEEEGD
jgi:hypothetical protein